MISILKLFNEQESIIAPIGTVNRIPSEVLLSPGQKPTEAMNKLTKKLLTNGSEVKIPNMPIETALAAKG